MNRPPLPAAATRTAFALLFASTLVAARPAAAATVSWAVDADGAWNNPANWSGAAVPTLSDTVIIDRPSGLYTITVPSGTHAAYSILSNERLVLDAGVLTVANTVQVNAEFVLDGAELVGATVMPGSGGQGVDAVSGTLNGVVMNADLDVSAASSRTITLVNGLTLNGTALLGADGGFGRFSVNGTMTLDGTGEIVLGSSSGSSGILVGFGAALTIESGLAIHGGRGTIGTNATNRRLVLRAPVTAEVTGQTIDLEGDSLLIQARVSAMNGATLRIAGTWANQDSLVAGSGSTLNLDGTWTNQGGIRMADGTVLLGGSVTTAGIGGFVRSGGTVTVDGTIDNTGDQLTLDGNTGTWVLSGGTVLGGSVEPGLAGSELKYGGNSTLNGVVMNADMDLSEAYSITVNLSNGLTLNGAARLGDSGGFGRFVTAGAMSIGGTGDIVLGRSSTNNGILVGFGSALTIESGIEIGGARGGIGTTGRPVTQRGTLRADSAGFAITLEGNPFANEGSIIGALGTINNGAAIVNTGLVRADSGAIWSGGGSLVQNDGATVLAAGITFTGPFTMNGGTLSGDGSFALDVVVNGGTIVPGASPGLLSGARGIAQTGGALAVELAGSDPADHDRLAFGTTAALAGSLGVGLLDGFLPAIGDTFTLVSAPSVTGQYAPVELPYMNSSQRWLVDPAADAYRLIVEFNPPPAAVCRDTALIAGPDCEATVAAADLDGGTTEPNGDPFTLALDPPGPYAIGAHLVSFIATDSLGAADTCITTITVTNAAPVAAANDTMLISNAACEADVAAADLDAGTADPEGQPFSLELAPAGPYPVGANAVLFIATDACGAADTVQITITVGNPPPIAAGRDTTLIGPPPGYEAGVDPAALDDGSSDPAGQALTFALAPSGPYALGEHVVQFIANDACGAADTTLITIAVVNQAPMAMCNDTTLVANLSCEGDVTPAGIDNGSIDPESGALTFELVPPPPYAIGVHEVLFIAIDGLGNADTCQTTIGVINNPPVASAIDATIVGQPPAWSVDVSAADVDSFTVDPDGHGLTLALEPPGPYGLGTHPVLFIATDVCGAADTTQITIAIINNPPVAMARDTTLLVVVDSCRVGMSAAALDDGSFDPEGAPVMLALDPPPPYMIGIHPVSFIATDDCGASDTTQITVTVFNTKPVAMAITQLVLQGDSLTCGASAAPSAFDDGSSDADGHALIFTAEPPAPYPYGTTQVMFIASDGCESDTVMTEVLVECALAGTEPGERPLQFAATQPMPNPFHGTTRIRLSLPEARHVHARVFDIAGRRVADLVDRVMEPGHWDVAWDGRRDDGTMSGAGVYLLRVQAGRDMVVRRAIRVR